MQLSVEKLNALNGTAGAGTATKNDAASSDRFLKLLVAQMQNQDPLNPMDNAQVTTQMAQISTVDGIGKLNTSVQGLNTQFMQMQALQGATLVGRDVTVAGDRLAPVGGQWHGGFEIGSAADRVEVEVLNGAGNVVDKFQLGAQGAGRHAFEWPGAKGADGGDYRFRVNAASGAAQVLATPLMLDRVQSVSFGGNTLNLDLARSGPVPYGDVVAFN
jgi:flagellar basal-body rod modification protein FlgD